MMKDKVKISIHLTPATYRRAKSIQWGLRSALFEAVFGMIADLHDKGGNGAIGLILDNKVRLEIDSDKASRGSKANALKT